MTITKSSSDLKHSELLRGVGALRQTFWQADIASLPPLQRAGLMTLRIAHGVYLDLRQGQLTLRAMSLVYSTLFAMVPTLAISFSVLKGLGVHNQVRPVLENMLAPLGEKSPEIVDTIIGFVDNMNLRVLGFIGVALLFYTVISLVYKIESSFNAVWQIRRSRSLAQRFRDYLSIILVGPVLIFSALGVMAGLLASELVSSVLQFAPLAQVIAAGSWAMPTVIIILAFTFFYFFIPNTKVRPRSALIGGIIAGLAWNGVGWAFATFVVSLPGYTQVYASFASPLIFLIWIYLSWTVLLIGASIGFYHQHAVNFPNYRGPLILGQQAREAAVLAVVRAIGGEFFNNRGGLGAAEISQRLGMPTYIADLALGWMEDAEFVTMTADHDPRYVPAKPWDKVNIHALLQSLRVGADDGAVRLAKLPADDQAAIEAIQQRYSAATEQSVGAMTLRQFATAPAANISSLSPEAANSD